MPRVQYFNFNKKYQDNPNPNAKIGFVIFYPFQFYVYKNIYKYLKNDAEFIVDLGGFYPIEQPEYLDKELLSILKKHNVNFRVLYYGDYFYTSYLEKFFSKYNLLISLWERGCLNLACNFNKKKVRLAYGSGKELTMYRPSGRIYDLTLAYGERDSKAFSLFSECKIVGNPKFDDWFNDEFDTTFLRELKQKLNPSQKTILYLPTHSDLGSINDLAEPLKKAARNYNIIIKLHYYNITDEPELVEKLKHKDLILFKDDTDLLPLLKVADVVLSDNSSAIFDAILADKPVIVTDFLSKEFLDIKHKSIKLYRRGMVTATTCSGSIEQKIKKDGLVITIQTPEQLIDGIERGLLDEPFYKNARKKIRKDLFAFNDGNSGKRAAEAVINLLNNKELPEKTILCHALEVFENQLRTSSFLRRKGDAQKISEYENLLFKKIEEERGQTTIFSVIIICNHAKAEFLRKEFLRSTLRSILEQNFPVQNYEIIIVNSPPEEEIRKIIKGLPLINGEFPAIKYIAPSKDNLNVEFIGDAINKAAGEIICFTESGYVAPSDWLLNFYLAYKKHSDITGVGGYIVKYPNAYNIFDEYYYLELGKKLGVNRENHYLEKLYEVKNSLFYQNPAGALVNMSYKKEILKDLPVNYRRILFLELVEMMIKKEVLLGGNFLYFIPLSVVNLEKMTFEKFIQKNFQEGLVFYLFCLANKDLEKYYLYNIFSVVKLPLANIFGGYRKTSLSFVIFIGTLFRWVGKLYGLLIMASKDRNE